MFAHDARPYDIPKEVFGPYSGTALYRIKKLDVIGLFDEEFFLLMADVDLAIRARLAGWNSTCVHDVVRAYKLLLMQGKRGEIYNICSEGGSIIDIVMLFSNMYHMKVEVHQEQSEFRPMDNPRIVGCNKKIQKDTGWEPMVPFEESLLSMYEYWFNQSVTGTDKI